MFTNVFPPPVASRILFLKTPKEHWSVLKTFLSVLNFMPDYLEKINKLTPIQTSVRNNNYSSFKKRKDYKILNETKILHEKKISNANGCNEIKSTEDKKYINKKK